MTSQSGSSSKRGRREPFDIDRRGFLKLSAFTGAAIAASHLIKHPALRPVMSLQEASEGVISENWLTTSCLNCPTCCATRVRVVNGKAVKIDGNPLSRVSEGEVCPRAHIGLQVLYDPDRLSSPLKRSNPDKSRDADPGWVPISWAQALSEITARLRTLRSNNKPHRLLLLHGLNTASDEDMICRFADAYGTPNVISADALDNEAEKSSRWMADGNFSHIAYDLGSTNYILAFGASIVESQKPLARNLRMWGKLRRERPNRAKVVVIDPRYSVTAAKADRWLPINPGTDGALAMAIANVIISEGLYDKDFIRDWTSGFDEYKKPVLSDYSPERAAGVTGIGAEVIRSVAREFARTRPAIAWVGRGAAAWPNG
ncbi:MAG: molybdopterin-dependent oxidoreductase, partial [Armatimonadetes bacterium]|nr:molybdopterin-dependent oxidoreductase [Armatimonadota bacterium]